MVKEIKASKTLLSVIFILLIIILLSSFYINYQVKHLPLVNMNNSLTNEGNESLNSWKFQDIYMIEDDNKTILNSDVNMTLNSSHNLLSTKNDSLNQS